MQKSGMFIITYHRACSASPVLRVRISSHNYKEIIRIYTYLNSYLNLKPVNWNFINNQFNFALFITLLQPCDKVGRVKNKLTTWL